MHKEDPNEMKTTGALRFVLLLSFPLVLSLPGEAPAQSCEDGCGLQIKPCMADAIPEMLACKLDCRTNTIPTELGICMRGCSDVFQAAKEGCRLEVQDCEEACEGIDDPPSDPEDPAADPTEDPIVEPDDGSPAACVQECGQTLGTCARDVTTSTRSCITDCRSGEHKRGTCMKQCVGPAKESAQLCATGFRSCMTDCGIPLAPRVPHCQDSEAPTCGGLCGGLSQVCAPVGPERCGCVRQ